MNEELALGIVILVVFVICLAGMFFSRDSGGPYG